MLEFPHFIEYIYLTICIMRQAITTQAAPNLWGLDAPRVWNVELAFQHLSSLGQAHTKRTAQRRLQKLALLPQELSADALRDEQGGALVAAVLGQQLGRARSKRTLVLFAQLHDLPGGQRCLHANDARGARYWLPLDAQLPDAPCVAQALEQLRTHIGKKDVAIFPHGILVAQCRKALLPCVSLLAYPSVLDLSVQASWARLTKMGSTPHLKRLEAESVHLIREAVAEAENPAMLYSVGKDCGVMLHLARKAFYPAPPPFPLLHVDTCREFQEMYLFRDYMARECGMELLVHADITQTEGLKQVLDKYQFDVVFGGVRRDDEKSHSKEYISSFCSATHRWEPKSQRPELWNLFNTRKGKGESIRVFPLSNWTEQDILQYILQEHIAVAPLYFAKENPVVRDGMIFLPGEEVQGRAIDRDASASRDEFLQEQQRQNLLRFITCASVDDGKSTLMGRLLWESSQLFDDHHIDVAYRFFATRKRKFIVADTPGHEQYTRNLVTGASTADVAVLLVDARSGLLVQTRRHAYLMSLVGIKHVVLAVNKMDLVGYSAATFDTIVDAFKAFAPTLGFVSMTAIPVSALKGDNVIVRSARTPWYRGPTLMDYLEAVDVQCAGSDNLVFPVQWMNRSDSRFLGFSGTVVAGSVKSGDMVRVTASGQTAMVTGIVTMDGNLDAAAAGQAVTLTLDHEVDASRGDVLSLAQSPLAMTDQFEATLVWMHEDAGLIGRSYDIKLANQWAGAAISNIKYRVNVNTLAHEACKQLALNDISVCNITTSKSLVFDSFDKLAALGRFVLVDRVNNATVAVGMIRHNLRRAQNVHKQAVSVTRTEREKLNGHLSKVIWFTGLSGSGKSTLANALEVALHAQGVRTYLLDGDNVRQGLNKDLGFTEADRVENIRRIAEVARLMMDAGLIVMTAFISPYRRDRDMARELIGPENFFEVFVNTPLAVCEQRDVKGLYKKARAGLIPNFTGVNSPYEPPLQPDLELMCNDGSLKDSIDSLVRQLNSIAIS